MIFTSTSENVVTLSDVDTAIDNVSFPSPEITSSIISTEMPVDVPPGRITASPLPGTPEKSAPAVAVISFIE